MAKASRGKAIFSTGEQYRAFSKRADPGLVFGASASARPVKTLDNSLGSTPPPQPPSTPNFVPASASRRLSRRPRLNRPPWRKPPALPDRDPRSWYPWDRGIIPTFNLSRLVPPITICRYFFTQFNHLFDR